MSERFALVVAAGALAALLTAPGAAALAQAAVPASPASAQAAAVGPDDLGDRTPRGAMRTYLARARQGDYAAAAGFLDLSALPARDRAEQGPRLARELQIVIDRTLRIDPDALSEQPGGLENDGLPQDRDRLGTIRSRGGPADLLLARVPVAGGGEVWRISSSTVSRVPEFYAQHGYPPIVDRLPREFVDWRAFDTDLWQWIGLLVLALAAWVFAFLVAWVVQRLVLILVHRTETDLDNKVAEALHRPLRLTVALYLFLAGSYWLRLALPIQDVLGSVTRGLTILLVTWMFLRVVDIMTRAAQERMLREERRGAVSMVNLGRRAAKVLIFALGVIGLLQNLGFNITGVVAGLGIGGLAVALAAQKTLENVFGGVALTMDRPIRVGDFCKFGEKTGTVEDVGLRSTRFRTPDRTVISVPNAELAAIEIENYTVRDRFRLFATIGVRYETSPDQVRWLVERIRALLAEHPRVVPDPLRVRFTGFGASSLDIEIFTFIGTQDIDEFYAIREELYLRILALVAEAGTGFAFPSQTLYCGRDGAPDRERAAAVARELAGRQAPGGAA